VTVMYVGTGSSSLDGGDRVDSFVSGLGASGGGGGGGGGGGFSAEGGVESGRDGRRGSGYGGFALGFGGREILAGTGKARPGNVGHRGGSATSHSHTRPW
jgi:hypothetical protein